MSSPHVRVGLLIAAAALLVVNPAAADEPSTRAPDAPGPDEPLASRPGYAQMFATAMGGTGLRFNNPYRLSTALGSDAESVSRTSAYVDLGLAMTLGSPLGLQHGAALRTSASVEGVGQVVMTPSYFAWRRKERLALFGRAGVPLVLSPDFTLGLEAGLGGAFFFTGGLGVVGEIVGDVFYGTGTREVRTTTYPVLSGQIGLIATYEVLP